jgi:hypothetical protein
VGVQEVRWDKVGTVSAGDYIFYMDSGLLGKPGGKWGPERLRHGWEDIKMDDQELGLEGMNWIDVTQDRDRWQALVNTVMNLQVPSN